MNLYKLSCFTLISISLVGINPRISKRADCSIIIIRNNQELFSSPPRCLSSEQDRIECSFDASFHPHPLLLLGYHTCSNSSGLKKLLTRSCCELWYTLPSWVGEPSRSSSGYSHSWTVQQYPVQRYSLLLWGSCPIPICRQGRTKVNHTWVLHVELLESFSRPGCCPKFKSKVIILREDRRTGSRQLQ